MTKQNRVQFTDQDGDVLAVSTWPVVPGIVFEARFKGIRNGHLVELNKDQVNALIQFLQANV